MSTSLQEVRHSHAKSGRQISDPYCDAVARSKGIRAIPSKSDPGVENWFNRGENVCYLERFDGERLSLLV